MYVHVCVLCLCAWLDHFECMMHHTYVSYICAPRTVEVNNTDAEGRLVLGDGVSRECEGY